MTWTWPTLADAGSGGLSERDARRYRLWDEAVTAVVPLTGPRHRVQCVCGRQERAETMYRVPPGLGSVYGYPWACMPCLATLERQGDLTWHGALAALGAPAAGVARWTTYAAARPHAPRHPLRRRKRWT